MTDTIGSSADDYREQLKKLTPQGIAIPTENTSNFVKLLDALAQECARVDAMAVLLINESFPDTTQLLLPNWERVAGLPDECSQPAETLQLRRKALLAKVAARGGCTKQYFIDIALTFGFEITITEFNEFRVDHGRVEDPLCGEAWEFTFQVNAPEETINYFRAGESTAGEPLRNWGNERLECLINRLKPAQTLALFAYGD
jgi:uncharacterized protein YmfQ (DUF2313 family)